MLSVFPSEDATTFSLLQFRPIANVASWAMPVFKAFKFKALKTLSQLLQRTKSLQKTLPTPSCMSGPCTGCFLAFGLEFVGWLLAWVSLSHAKVGPICPLQPTIASVVHSNNGGVEEGRELPCPCALSPLCS